MKFTSDLRENNKSKLKRTHFYFRPEGLHDNATSDKSGMPNCLRDLVTQPTSIFRGPDGEMYERRPDEREGPVHIDGS